MKLALYELTILVMWFAVGNGLAKFDQTNRDIYISLTSLIQAGFENDIAFDSLGNKWIATEHGLYKLMTQLGHYTIELLRPCLGDCGKCNSCLMQMVVIYSC
ncbi:MAG: hypothetical protein IPN88_04615 [Bacteroidetes bacterium]|nr:hypothetical protein [Bacteroidota bacterium]